MVAGGRLGEDGVSKVNRVLLEMELIVRPFDERQARLAHEAFRKFGKGVHSKARLNMGDCASYALARSLNAPLLFKGDDFPHTDIVAAV